MSDNVVMSPPPLVSEELWDLWKYHADELYARDGRAPNFPHGGHDIANNQTLRDTLDELAKRYLPMCVEKFGFLNEHVMLSDQMVNDDECDVYAVTKRLDEIGLQIEEFDKRLVHTNVSSMLRLLAPDSGLEVEAQREALGSSEERRKLAFALLAPVIKYAVAAACEYSGYNAQLATHPTLVQALKGFVPRTVGTGKDLS